MYSSTLKWVLIGLQEGLDEDEDDAVIKLEIVLKDIEEQDEKKEEWWQKSSRKMTLFFVVLEELPRSIDGALLILALSHSIYRYI